MMAFSGTAKQVLLTHSNQSPASTLLLLCHECLISWLRCMAWIHPKPERLRIVDPNRSPNATAAFNTNDRKRFSHLWAFPRPEKGPIFLLACRHARGLHSSSLQRFSSRIERAMCVRSNACMLKPLTSFPDSIPGRRTRKQLPGRPTTDIPCHSA